MLIAIFNFSDFCVNALDKSSHREERIYLDIADIQVLASVSTCQVPHNILIVIFHDSHDQIGGGHPISTLRLFEFSGFFHLYAAVEYQGKDLQIVKLDLALPFKINTKPK